MCYSCIKGAWLRVAPEVLRQQGNDRATPELLDSFESLAFVLQSAACFDKEHARGHANPICFATAVVAEQMVGSVKNDGANLSPDRMLRFLRQALRRMNTVEDLNPYGRAVTVGLLEMPGLLRELNDMLLSDEGNNVPVEEIASVSPDGSAAVTPAAAAEGRIDNKE